jgi:hypothetical protein
MIQMQHDFPPVFRSVREMEAYDEGDDTDSICALCGERINEARAAIIRDNDGLIRAEICERCYESDS